ncbi:MAG: DUF5723 family protein [Bacteroidia bacterium]|nr:DUF5723 family protein [Bacteroidia bacterium]
MRKLLIFSLVFISLSQVMAQNNLTLYNIKPVPQRMAINPAFTPTCKWYFGTPALSSLNFSYNSHIIGLNELSSALEPNGSNYTLDMTKLSNVFSNGVSVNSSYNHEWIGFGFRLRKSMWSFSINEKLKSRVLLPSDFFRLVFEGNGGDNVGDVFDLGFAMDFIHTREFALGYSCSFIDDKLRIGGRIKYIAGINAIQTQRNDLIFETSEKAFTYNVKSDLKFNSSLMPIDSNTTLNSVLLGNQQNSGFGIDVGANIKLNKKLSISASIIDLGVVQWKGNLKSTFTKNPGVYHEYRGMDIQDFLVDSSNQKKGFETFKDTLMEIIALDTSSESFSTGLMGEFYVGGNLSITKNHNVGALMCGSFYRKEFYPALTLSWNSQIGNILALSASYTIYRESYVNLGFGVALNLGPEQFYITTDNAIGSVTDNTRNLGVHFGWNHIFGKKKDKKIACEI